MPDLSATVNLLVSLFTAISLFASFSPVGVQAMIIPDPSTSTFFPPPNSTTTTTTATATPTPTPTRYTMSCALSYPCNDLCHCSGTSVNCHADPTSKCMFMCNCKVIFNATRPNEHVPRAAAAAAPRLNLS